MHIALTVAVLLCMAAFSWGCLSAKGKILTGESELDDQIKEHGITGLCILGAIGGIVGMPAFIMNFMPLAIVGLVLMIPMLMLAFYKSGFAFMKTLL